MLQVISPKEKQFVTVSKENCKLFEAYMYQATSHRTEFRAGFSLCTNAENRKKNGCTIYELYQVFGIANVALFDGPRGKLQLQQLDSSDFFSGCIGLFFVALIKKYF